MPTTMTHPRRWTRLACLVLLGGGFAVLPLPLRAQRPLDHDAYDRWRTIEQERLSRDGRWLAYVLDPEQGDATLVVRATDAAVEYQVPRGRDAAFTADGRFAVFTLRPEFAAVRAAKRAKAKSEDLPKDSLGMLDLSTGTVVKAERVVSFQVPERGGTWVAYLLERSPAQATADSAPGDSAAPSPKPEAEVGRPLVLRDLVRGTERRVDDVTAYVFTRDGSRLAVATSSRTGEGDGLTVLDVPAGAPQAVLSGRGRYLTPAFDEAGAQLAFLSTRDEADREHPRFTLYRWRAGQREAQPVARSGMSGVPEGWTVSEHRAPSFSRNGARLFFGTAPWAPPEPPDSTPDDERVVVDVWHWRDAELQPMQLRRLAETRRRAFLAVAHLPAGRLVQLADTLIDEITLPEGSDGPFALGEADARYRALISWDSPAYRDVYAVDLETGRRTLVLQRTQAALRLAPGGTYAAWFDLRERAGYARHLASGRTARLTEAIAVPLFDEEHDVPAPAPPYGFAGWTADDRELLVYDRFDVWALDPEGRRQPRLVTEGVGRRDSVRFRVVDLDPDRDAVPADAPLLLSAFHEPTKRAGFYRDRVRGDRPPEPLLMADRRFSRPRKAAAADRLLFSRQSVAEFPDVWVANLEFTDARKLSDANPQQGEYRWATAELMRWRSVDGTPLEGLLYKPADFDAERRYPLMVYFYERNADNLHAHHAPLPHRSVIRPTFYASRGYVVFVPDVVYREGYPGESAMDCVIPGVLELVRRGIADPARIGVQGHSWGGYQIAYMVTKTNLFRAAAAGAPVANMTSAYGGIRWESGMSRMFQYERTQSRLGASLWEVPLRYLENSPLFWLDRVETPLLILHNDADGAVPWYQGIELFTGLRRLGKPAWLVNYNGEPHWPLPYPKRRDWNIRLQQFFDHYLRDAPAPRWLVEGIPATEKGRTLGLETEW